MIYFTFWIQSWDIDLKKLEIWLQTEQQNKALQEAKIAAEKLIKEAVERAEQDAEKKVHSFFSFSIFKIFNFQISSLKSDVEVLSDWMKSQQKKSAELTIWKRHSQVKLAKNNLNLNFNFRKTLPAQQQLQQCKCRLKWSPDSCMRLMRNWNKCGQ